MACFVFCSCFCCFVFGSLPLVVFSLLLPLVDGVARVLLWTQGDLFVKFAVEFPEKGSLDPATCTALAGLLPKSDEPEPEVAEDAEEITITEVDMDAVRERARAGRDAYDSDDEPRGGQRVQCAQQ